MIRSIAFSLRHSDTGLMREIWTLKDLTRNRPDDWQFSRTQREELRSWRAMLRGFSPAPVG